MPNKYEITKEEFDLLIKDLTFITNISNYPKSPFIHNANFKGRYIISHSHHEYLNLYQEKDTKVLILEEISMRRISDIYYLSA